MPDIILVRIESCRVIFHGCWLQLLGHKLYVLVMHGRIARLYNADAGLFFIGVV